MIKKAVAGVVAATMVTAMSVPVMAADVTAAFIHAGTSEAKTVAQGSNVTAPAVPLVAGYTFCGYDKSLYNIQANTAFNAVYVPTAVGEAVIAATKASLPTPAVTDTTVADPNAAATAPAADSVSLEALQRLIAAQAAQAQQVAQTALPAVTGTVETPVATTGPALIPAAAVGVPSWVVGLEGVDAAGAAKAYNYLKNTKGFDDATIQGNWGAFMHHYAEYGTQGW